MVPSSTIIFYIIEIMFAVTTPITIFAIFRFRKLTAWAPFLSGFASCFIYFPFVALVDYLVSMDNAISSIIRNSPFLWLLVFIMSTILIEEGARYVIFRFVLLESKKKYDGIAYGLGISLLELFVVSVTPFLFTWTAMEINSMGAEAYINHFSSQADILNVTEMVDYLIHNVTVGEQIINILRDVVVCIVIQLGISLICFYAVKKKCMDFFWLGCILHALYLLPSGLESIGIIQSKNIAFLLESLIALFCVYVTARIFKDFDKPPKDIKKFFGIGLEKQA